VNPSSFRPFQTEALRILGESSSAHVVCMAPTGMGKSLIFETLAQKPYARTLIVSPLRALIRQQELALESRGILIDPRLQCTANPRHPIAWVTTPESLSQRMRAGWHPPSNTLLVVDECHCIEEWGETFRPEFSLLPKLPELWKLSRSLWLSATLTPHARSLLGRELPQPQRWVGEFGLHPHLRLRKLRIPKIARPQLLAHWLNSHPEPGIVFCASRKSCQEMARRLEIHSQSLHEVGLYHAGLTHEERLSMEERARRGRLRWLAATSAFGMGMNFPQFAWVLLWETPYTLASLAQMLGRCGRSLHSQPEALVLWDESDLEGLCSEETESGQKIREFFRSTDEPSVWLKEFFS
jgi:ATP-dependent DNA helicase RecQ